MSRVEKPVGEFDSRLPVTLELTSEGWLRLGVGDTSDEWIWMHPPSRRTVVARERDGVAHVFVSRHDEHGNPIGNLCYCGGTCENCRAAFSTLGPFPILGEAMRIARAIRLSILANLPDARWADQVELFADIDADAANGGPR